MLSRKMFSHDTVVVPTQDELASLLACGYLSDELELIQGGWSKKNRARKKFLRKHLNIGLRVLRSTGLCGGPKSKRLIARFWSDYINKPEHPAGYVCDRDFCCKKEPVPVND